MDGERENVSVYVVKEGDNVDRIAETAGIPVGELLWANQIEYPYRLAVGQSLLIPEGSAADREQSISVYFKGDGGADASVSDRSLYFFLRLYRTGNTDPASVR